MSFRRFIVLLSGLIFTVSAPAFAQNKSTFIVVVQNYKEFPPYSEYKQNKYGGFNREILDLFAKSRGYRFQYKAFPVKRLFHEFVNGVGDLKYPDNPNWARHIKKDAKIKYSDPVVEYVDGVMVHPENKGRKVSELKKLGLVAGWTPIPYLEQIKSGQIKLFENNSYSGLLKQVMLGRIDGAYSNVSTSRYYLRNTIKKSDGLVFDPSLPHVRHQRVLSSINQPQLIEEFNRFLKTNALEIDRLKAKYQVEDGIK